MIEFTWENAEHTQAQKWLSLRSPTRFEACPGWLSIKNYDAAYVWLLADGNRIALIPLASVPLKFGYRYLYSPGAPVFDEAWRDMHRQHEIWKYLFTTAVREWIGYGGKRRIFDPDTSFVFWRVEPGILRSVSDIIFVQKFRYLRKSIDIIPASTILVDLKDDWKNILARMRQKTRYNVKIGGKRGLEACVITELEEVLAGVELMLATAARDKFKPHPREHYELLWSLADSEELYEQTGLRLRMYGVREPKNGTLIASAFGMRFGDTFTYVHGGSDYRYRSMMGSYALQAFMMREAKESGARWYDLYGVAPEHATDAHPWHGITRFKNGFGGECRHGAGTYDCILDAPAYVAYSFARSVRRFERFFTV